VAESGGLLTDPPAPISGPKAHDFRPVFADSLVGPGRRWTGLCPRLGTVVGTVGLPRSITCAPFRATLDGAIMKLDPDEEKLLESFERGDWKPTPGDQIARMRELARQQLRVDVEAGLNTLARSDGHSHDAESDDGSPIRSRPAAERHDQRSPELRDRDGCPRSVARWWR
jgi:hypothetical protein